MPVYKDDERGTWFVSVYFQDWKGQRNRKLKRGFKTKKDAATWERVFLQQTNADLSMTFSSFLDIYTDDIKKRLKENTWLTKEAMMQGKILPYFKDKKLCEIRASDVIQWQNEMLQYRNEKGESYSPVYLKTLHNQLSAIFNHAVRFYDLPSNPARKAGTMGKETNKEIEFWTKEEYLAFAESMMDKPIAYYAFEVLYWTGIRLGELLALTASDFNFKTSTLTISKSYQRLKGKDVVTSPKTEKSNRVIQMPDFLCEEIKDYIDSLYAPKQEQRIFPMTKSYLHREMERGSKEAKIKKIKLHSLRHSHISLLIEMGFSAVAIANRVGHESIDITYRYAHMFPSTQKEMAAKLTIERGSLA